MDEGIEGVIEGLGGNAKEGVVIEMEYRRKSGRAVGEWFYLPLKDTITKTKGVLPGGVKEKVILLEDHPEWRASEVVGGGKEEDGMLEGDDEGQPKSTFSLGLTEEQRRKREEVVLPYFDAQRSEGIGGGGAILFTPDREIDDFDDEEDEI